MLGPEESSLKSIAEHFEELPDPRSEVNREHLLVDVIVISICAILAGADGPTAIAVWAKSPSVSAWLKQHLALPNGIPSKDTYRRVLQRLRPEAFQRCFESWLQSLVGTLGVRFLAIDGKTLRRSHDRKHDLGALHLVSVWATEQKLTLAQVATSEKSNEITAIPQVLDLVDVKNAIVTIDAMGTQTAIAAKIVEGGGDYVLPVKGNQGGLEQAVTEFFADQMEDDFARVKVSRFETTETHHGRVEQRSYFQVNVPDDLPGRQRWKGLRTLGMVVRAREINGVETDEIQCSISSLKRNVKLFAKAARGHWGIENTCHWTLDMTFREDESRTRDRHPCENLGWLRRFALGLLKQHPNTKTSLAMKRRQAGWCLSFLSEVLFNSTTSWALALASTVLRVQVVVLLLATQQFSRRHRLRLSDATTAITSGSFSHPLVPKSVEPFRRRLPGGLATRGRRTRLAAGLRSTAGWRNAAGHAQALS